MQSPELPNARAGSAGLSLRGRTRRWLREPLLHFLVIGAAMFLVYRLLNGAEPASPRDIVVTESRVDALAENFARTWMRPPTPLELKGLVDDYVAEEVYSREAVAIGLDRDDTVIRRRLRQKMEFVTDDAVGSQAATDTQLQAYLDSHAAAFVTPGRVTFEQVFLSLEHRGAAVQGDAQRILRELQSGRAIARPAELGDPTLLPESMQAVAPQDVDNSFGTEFTQAVMKATPGQWFGPVRSGYGVHLVRVSSVEAGSLPPLVQIRPAVEREWQAEQRKLAKDALLKQLLSRYDVRIEGPLGEALRQAGQGASPGTAP